MIHSLLAFAADMTHAARCLLSDKPCCERAAQHAADLAARKSVAALAAHFDATPRDYDPVAVWRELDDRNLADRLNEWETQA